jgi:hypothetical protein
VKNIAIIKLFIILLIDIYQFETDKYITRKK